MNRKLKNHSIGHGHQQKAKEKCGVHFIDLHQDISLTCSLTLAERSSFFEMYILRTVFDINKCSRRAKKKNEARRCSNKTNKTGL